MQEDGFGTLARYDPKFAFTFLAVILSRQNGMPYTRSCITMLQLQTRKSRIFIKIVLTTSGHFSAFSCASFMHKKKWLGHKVCAIGHFQHHVFPPEVHLSHQCDILYGAAHCPLHLVTRAYAITFTVKTPHAGKHNQESAVAQTSKL